MKKYRVSFQQNTLGWWRRRWTYINADSPEQAANAVKACYFGAIVIGKITADLTLQDENEDE